MTQDDVRSIRTFLTAHTAGITREQWELSYPSWSHGGSGWNALQSGGTVIMQAIMWYQHIHRPGSHEWRPAVIIAALRSRISQVQP